MAPPVEAGWEDTTAAAGCGALVVGAGVGAGLGLERPPEAQRHGGNEKHR